MLVFRPGLRHRHESGDGLRLGTDIVRHGGLVCLGHERHAAGKIAFVCIVAARIGHLLRVPHTQGRGGRIVTGDHLPGRCGTQLSGPPSSAQPLR